MTQKYLNIPETSAPETHQMTAKSDALAAMRQDFVRRYEVSFAFERRSFEMDLDRLIYLAFEVATEPYVRELQINRELSLQHSILSPAGLKGDAP